MLQHAARVTTISLATMVSLATDITADRVSRSDSVCGSPPTSCNDSTMDPPGLKDGRQCSVECRGVSFGVYFQAISEAASSLDVGSYRPVLFEFGPNIGPNFHWLDCPLLNARVRKPILHSCVVVVDQSQEDRQMWLYVLTWLPLLSISLTAAICFGVASFVMGQAQPRTGPF